MEIVIIHSLHFTYYLCYNLNDMDKKHEAMFYEKMGDKRVKCTLCPRYCHIASDKAGYCGARKNENGKLYSTIYARASSVAVDPIEKKPLFNFHPGTTVLSLGTWGCNMRCIHCQNWQISHAVMVEGLEQGKVYNIINLVNISMSDR